MIRNLIRRIGFVKIRKGLIDSKIILLSGKYYFADGAKVLSII